MFGWVSIAGEQEPGLTWMENGDECMHLYLFPSSLSWLHLGNKPNVVVDPSSFHETFLSNILFTSFFPIPPRSLPSPPSALS